MTVTSPASRATDPHSSYDAECHINRTGIRARQQSMASKAVEMWPGLTSLELANKSQICRYLLARRLPECQMAKQVRRGQERRCSVSGRLAVTWHPPGSVEQMGLFNRERAA
jgi:hypothetical protein